MTNVSANQEDLEAQRVAVADGDGGEAPGGVAQLGERDAEPVHERAGGAEPAHGELGDETAALESGHGISQALGLLAVLFEPDRERRLFCFAPSALDDERVTLVPEADGVGARGQDGGVVAAERGAQRGETRDRDDDGDDDRAGGERPTHGAPPAAAR
jgi:hypothetical protein